MLTAKTDPLRLFIAIELPENVKSVIAQYIERLRALDRRRTVRWSAVESIHLTLKFLGSAPAHQVSTITEALGQAARRHAPFSLSLGGAGVFPNARKPRVIWLGVGGGVEPLSNLQAAVEQFVAPLGYPTDSRPFNAHLTIGRVKPDADRDTLAKILEAAAQVAADPAVWQVKVVSLMRSVLTPDGAVYTCLQRQSLRVP